MASAGAVRLSASVEKQKLNSCAGRGRNLKVCPSVWLFTSPWYARVVCSLELGSADPIRMAGSINKGCGAGLSTCTFPRRDKVDEQSLV